MPSRRPTCRARSRSVGRAFGSRRGDARSSTSPSSPPSWSRCWRPEPGQTAVDCTFGGGGHARRVAELLGPEGTLIGDRPRPRRRRSASTRFAAEVALPDAASSAPTSRQGFAPCTAKASAQTWSTWTSECPRCRSMPGSGASPTPTTRRSTCGWTRARSSAPPTSSTSGPSRGSPRSCAASARSATPAGSRARSSAAARCATTSELVDAIKAGMPASARFGGGHPAKRTFQAIRIAVNGELDSLEDALPTRLGHAADRRPLRRDLLPLARGPAASSSSSPSAPAAASARPSCRSASAAASPKPSC